jgi:hypothetical protein
LYKNLDTHPQIDVIDTSRRDSMAAPRPFVGAPKRTKVEKRDRWTDIIRSGTKSLRRGEGFDLRDATDRQCSSYIVAASEVQSFEGVANGVGG